MSTIYEGEYQGQGWMIKGEMIPPLTMERTRYITRRNYRKAIIKALMTRTIQRTCMLLRSWLSPSPPLKLLSVRSLFDDLHLSPPSLTGALEPSARAPPLVYRVKTIFNRIDLISHCKITASCEMIKIHSLRYSFRQRMRWCCIHNSDVLF